MTKLITFASVSLLVLVGFSPAAANDGFTYQNIGTPATSPSGMTVTVNSVDVVESGGSTKVAISYNERNDTSDKDPVQASFKLFFTDGTELNQYGGFNKIFPGNQQNRSYTFQFLSGKTPWLIEYDADFFAKVPTSTGLKWKVGSAYPGSSPAPVDTPQAPDSAVANDGFTYQNIGTPATSPSGMTVTVNSVDSVDSNGITTLAIRYSERNDTSHLQQEKGRLKLFFTDGTERNQFVNFDRVLPGGQQDRSYVFYFSNRKTPWLIEYEADFLAKVPTSTGLKWKVGSAYPESSPPPVVANDGFIYRSIGTPTESSSGMTVTVNSVDIAKGSDVTTVAISYNERNDTSGAPQKQRAFKLFFTDGTVLNQYGSFDMILPGGQQNRSYTFQFLSGKTPWMIEYAIHFDAEHPSDGVKWKVGSEYRKGYSVDVETQESSAPGEIVRFDVTVLDFNGAPASNTSVYFSLAGAGYIVTRNFFTGDDGKTYVNVLISDDAQGFVKLTAIAGYKSPGYAATSAETAVQRPADIFSVKQRTLATFSGSATGLTSQQRGQVKAAVEANPNAEKFICTGIRYYSQPMSVNIMVRKRAKAACEYAKELNPSLSTWYQNKPTQARSYAGKVLLTVKTPSE